MTPGWKRPSGIGATTGSPSTCFKDKDDDDAIPKLRTMIELLRRYGS